MRRLQEVRFQNTDYADRIWVDLILNSDAQVRLNEAVSVVKHDTIKVRIINVLAEGNPRVFLKQRN
jgi:hypothetical protein